jgi:hypothetical protein
MKSRLFLPALTALLALVTVTLPASSQYMSIDEVRA